MRIKKDIRFDDLLDLIPKINKKYEIKLRIAIECVVPEIDDMYFRCVLYNSDTVLYSDLSWDYKEFEESKQHVIEKIRGIVNHENRARKTKEQNGI